MKTNLDFIMFAIKQAKEAQAFGITRNHSCRNLKVVLLQYWQYGTLGIHNLNKKKMLRSKAAMKIPLSECRVEHIVPLTVIVNRLMDMKSLTERAVKNVLKKWYAVMLVTQEEDDRLRKKGLRFKMPEKWDEKNIFARYKAVGIRFGGTPKI